MYVYIYFIELERKRKQSINSIAIIIIINHFYWFSQNYLIVYWCYFSLLTFRISLLCKIEIVTLLLCCFINWPRGCSPNVSVCL
jgi:hypothetical protein